MKSFYILLFLIHSIIISTEIYPQFTWVKTNLPDGINVNNFAGGTNGELYAATSNGLYTTTNKGNNWIIKDYTFDGNDIKAISSKEPGILFVGPKNNNGFKIYRSNDHGNNWTTYSNFYFGDNVNAILYGVNGNIYVGVHYNYLSSLFNSIIRSTDEGSTWQIVKGINSNCDEALLVRNANGDLFATGVDLMVGSNISRSTDDGNSWIELNIGEDYSCITSININKNNHIFVGIWEDVYRSTNNGTTWTKLNANFLGTSVNAIIFDRFNNVYAGTNKGVYISSNNGNSWKQINSGLTNEKVLALIEDNDGIIYAGTQGGGIYRLTRRQNDFWQSLGGPNSSYAMGIMCLEIKDTIIFAGTQGDGIYKTTNEGNNWIKAIDGPPQPWDIITDTHGNIYVASTWGVYKSIDNGETWYRIFYYNGYVWDIAINGNGHIYIGTQLGSKFYRSTDEGATWEAIQNDFAFIALMAIGFDNYNNIYVGGNTSGNLYKSSDNGATWVDIDTSNVMGSVVKILKNSLGQIFVAANNGFYRITEEGQIIKLSNATSYTSYNTTLGPSDIFYRFEQYYGLYSSPDGASWLMISEELKDMYVRTMEFDIHGYLYIGCTNDTIYRSIEQVNLTMKAPVILIPGIMGSPLYDDADNDNHLRSWERAWLGPQLINLLLQDNGNEPVNPNAKIKPSPLHNDNYTTIEDELNKLPLSVYHGFFATLQQNGYLLDNSDDNHTQGENLFCFTYDWRKNNTGNAQLLSWFIDSVKKWTGAPKVNLVTHSMGGLISKKCISTYDKSRIEKIIFIGTPHLGAPESISVLYTGVLGRWYDFVTRAFVEKLARNLPSCYQLSPSIKYFDTGLNNNISIDVDKYLLCFQLANGSYASYIGMNEYINSTLNTELNNNAETFRQSISTVDFGNIKVFNIVGYNFATIGQIRVIPNFYPLLYRPARILNGDKTVPLRSAEIINNSIVENTYYIPNVEHQNMPSSSEGLEVILGILKNQSVTNFANPPQSYSAPNHIQVEVACPIAIHAYDTLGRHTGPLTDSTWEANIPGSIYIPGTLSDSTSTKTILLAKGSTYILRMETLNAYGNFNFFLQEVTHGMVNKILIYDSIPFQTNTSVMCSLNINYNLPQLEIDLNSDGTIDTLITPKDFTTEIKNMNFNISRNFELAQNYPNPFNPTTTIKFTVPEETNVNLSIYNVLGELVSTLVNEQLKPGDHEYEFNATSFASGIYLYRIKAGEFIKTRKMILLR